MPEEGYTQKEVHCQKQRTGHKEPTAAGNNSWLAVSGKHGAIESKGEGGKELRAEGLGLRAVQGRGELRGKQGQVGDTYKLLQQETENIPYLEGCGGPNRQQHQKKEGEPLSGHDPTPVRAHTRIHGAQ